MQNPVAYEERKCKDVRAASASRAPPHFGLGHSHHRFPRRRLGHVAEGVACMEDSHKGSSSRRNYAGAHAAQSSALRVSGARDGFKKKVQGRLQTAKNLAVRQGISKSSALFKKKKNVPWMPSMLVPKICHHVKYQPSFERRALSAEPLQ